MLNELRTLLANLPPDEAADRQNPFARWIPSDFRPRSWPDPLGQVRQLLFGTAQPDRWFVHWRLTQLEPLLEEGPVGEVAEERFGTQRTYVPGVLPRRPEFGLWLEYTPPASAQAVTVIEPPSDPNPPDRIYGEVFLRITNSDVEEMTLWPRPEPGRPSTRWVSLTWQGGEAEYQLAFPRVRFRIRTDAIDGTVRVRWLGRPRNDLAEVVNGLDHLFYSGGLARLLSGQVEAPDILERIEHAPDPFLRAGYGLLLTALRVREQT